MVALKVIMNSCISIVDVNWILYLQKHEFGISLKIYTIFKFSPSLLLFYPPKWLTQKFLWQNINGKVPKSKFVKNRKSAMSQRI